MVIYVLRVARLVLAQALKPRLPRVASFSISFRAWPWYCDTNLHLNNASYLTFMEYARWAWVTRAGTLGRAMRGRWVFLIAGVSLVYRRPLPMWRRFTVRSRLAGVEGRWIYVVQELLDHRGAIASRAIVRATVRGPSGAVAATELFEAAPTPEELRSELGAFDALTREHLQAIDAASASARPA